MYILFLLFFHIYQYGLGNVLSENIPVSDYALYLLSRRFLLFYPFGYEYYTTVLFLKGYFIALLVFLWYSIFGYYQFLFMKRILMEPLEYYTTIPFGYFYFKLVISSCLLFLMKLSFYFKQQAFNDKYGCYQLPY